MSILGLILVFGLAFFWIYIETREAYWKVGFNDGGIDAKERILEDIKRSVIIQDCQKIQSSKPPVRLLDIKADSLYLISTDEVSVKFCQWK